MNLRRVFHLIIVSIFTLCAAGVLTAAMASTPHPLPSRHRGEDLRARGLADDPGPPDDPVKLVFVHHSCGDNWLDAGNGGLGDALGADNYYVSDTYYGWGPDDIGSNTDIGHWWTWFRGPSSVTYTQALYDTTNQHASYTRPMADPGGENEVIMFKSCYPNSELGGGLGDPIPPIDSNPLRGQSCGSTHHTVPNAQGIYLDLLNYFETRQDKLFVVVTAPPRIEGHISPAEAANARDFNDWLVNDWLDDYDYDNVAVFDFFNVLTSNGGSPDVNDLGETDGNHHRWWNGAVQHVHPVDNDFGAYADDHPNAAGNQKATGEFVDLLNVFYNRWQGGSGPEPSLTLTAPNGGEEWAVSSTHRIQWTTGGTVTDVSLAYSTDGFVTSHTVESSLANTGRYSWTVPDDPGATVRLRVVSLVSPTTVYDDSDADFSICHCSDVDCDGDVDVADIQTVADLWRCAEGDGCYDARYDVNDDGVIDILDIMLVAAYWGLPSSDDALIQPDDLAYQGAFAYPAGDEWAYSGHALAYYPEGDPDGPADGYPGSLYAAGHANDDLVAEITIPEPVTSDDFDDLPKASVLRSLADVTGGWKDDCTYNDDCIYREVDGLAYLPNVDRVAWNLRDWYNVAGYDQDSLGWSDLQMTGAQGVWHIGERPSANDEFHNAKTCNYLFKAPESFADQYLDGKWLIAGNHREAGALGGSQGPTLYALAPWEDGSPPPSEQNLDALALLYYPEIYPGCLDDPEECHFPNYRPKDDWGGGAWLQHGGKSGVLIVGRKGLGDNCYGTQAECGGDPCDMYKGYHAYPYEPQILFYDPEELGEVIAGTKEPWEVLPYRVYRPMEEVLDSECATLGAAAYDRERRVMYVTEQQAGPWGETVVHVWQVE